MAGVSMRMPDLKNDNCDHLKLPSLVIEQCTSGASAEDVVLQLMSVFDESLQVKDTDGENYLDSLVGANGGTSMAVTVMSEKSRAQEHDKSSIDVPSSSSVKCLSKCATFPVMDHNSHTCEDSKDKAHASELLENASGLRSMSLPVSRKIIPAMKGSREKEGLTLKKLNVTWAPDVYDPIPSSVSHLPKKKNNQQYRNKKNAKGKQKGKSSRGSGKKEKKHHREEPSLGSKFIMSPISIGDTEKKFVMDPIVVANTEKIMSSNYKSTVELLDFDNDVDSPDSNCGSSFLRKSRGTLHFPYSETT